MGNIIRKTGNGNTKLLKEKQLNNQLSKKDFTISHQNIRGLNINKIDKISIYLSKIPIHHLCLSEHQLGSKGIEKIQIPNYKLSVKFCRNTFKKVEFVSLLTTLVMVLP
jgi:hypothetical protein